MGLNGRRQVACSALILASVLFSLSISACQSAGGGASPSSLARDYSALGDEYFRLSRFDKAEAAYRKALELDPSLTIGSYQLARSYAETGQTAKALSLVDFLLEKDPRNSLFIALKAFVLLKDGKADQARDAYAKLSDEMPWGEDVIFNLALLDIMEGRAEEALPRLEILLSQRPQDNEVILLLARARLLLGKEEEGRLLLSDYLEAKPTDLDAQRLMARSLVRSREYGAALEWWEKLQGGGKADAEVWFESAKIYALAMEDDQKGKDALRKAVQASQAKPLPEEDLESFLSSLGDERRQSYDEVLTEEKKKAEDKSDQEEAGKDAP